MRKSIGINNSSIRNSVGLGYIYLPANEDRKLFIKNCLRTSTVSIITENREIIHKVPIGKVALQFIEFPKDRTVLGTPVTFISHPTKNKPIIVDVYHFFDQDSNLTNENQFNFVRKSLTGKVVEVSGDAEAGIIRINVSGGDKGGKLLIDVNNLEKTGEVTLNVKGDVNFKLSGNLNLETLKTFNIFAKKENVEPILLGNKVVELLDQLLTQLGQESAGPYPLLGNSQYISLKENLEALKSTISFTE